MTAAPGNLLDVRRLLLGNLDDSAGSDDLEPAEVGIVGDSDHWGGYHCGSDRVVTNDYSVVESSRDREGLTLYASALDVGLFGVTTAKGTFNLPHMNRWIVAQCVAGAPDTRDIREIIYTADGTTVRRWDRLGRRSSGDSSHLYHTHYSFFRDAIKANRDQRPLFVRYLTHIGLLEDTTMVSPEEHAAIIDTDRTLDELDGRNALGQAYTRMALGEDHLLRERGVTYVPQHPSLRDLGTKLDTVLNAVASGNAADAIRDTELRAALDSYSRGEVSAEEFVDAVARRLAGPVPPPTGA